MPNTPVYGWRYQSLLVAPHGPNLGEFLALDSEATTVANAVTAAAASAAVAAALAATSPTTAAIATSQNTASTTYADLATPGPAVTIVTGTKALVVVSCLLFNSGVNSTYMGCAVSGASTVAASDANALVHASNAFGIRISVTMLLTGLTPGSNTFTAKYRVTAGTGTYQDRSIIVIPVP